MILKYDEIIVKNKHLIDKGEITLKRNNLFLLKGKNGSGKTLLIKNIFSNPSNSHISKVLIDQNNDGIFTSRTILQNISMSTDTEYNKKIERKMINMGFSYLLNRKPVKLSGGEKRIISILRGLISDVELVLIDEPTNDLDFVKVNELLKLIQKQLLNKTIFIISHDDRFKVSSNHIFGVENKKVNRHSEEKKNEAIQESKRNHVDKSEDLGFIRKIFSYNYVSVILCLILAFIITIQMISFRMSNEREIPVMKENQVDIFSINSDMTSSKPPSSVLPLSIFRKFHGGNPFEIMKEIERTINNPFNLGSAVDLDLENTSMFTVFNMEFINNEEGERILTIERYLERYHGESLETVIINRTPCFPWIAGAMHYEDAPSINIDLTRFKKIAEELNLQTVKNGGELEVVHISVILKEGYSFEEFLALDEVKTLEEGFFLISSNEVIEFVTESMKFRNTRRIVVTIVLSVVAVSLIEGINIVVYLNLKKSSIVNMKNFSVNQNKVIKAVQEKFNSRVYRFAFIIITLFIATEVFKGLAFSLVNYYFVVLFLLLMNMFWSLNNMIIKRIIEKIYNWRFR